ncbi:hypothetical protein [Spongiactinospora rosea]|uniref:hypothetical protein n=1 Tax=Spongiactinospora rosea TaxID=2248750 RepID=UPI0013145CE6|nr:hypothetical protein [Spongiactinospora rosea]
MARATAQLTGDLVQTYGVAENRQITRDGTIVSNAWGSEWETIKGWVARAGMPIV